MRPLLRFLFAITLLGFSVPAFPQSSPDPEATAEEVKVLLTEADSPEKVAELLELIEPLIGTQPEVAATYLEEVVVRAKGIEDQDGLVKAYNALGNARLYTGEYPKAVIAFEEYLDLERKRGDDFELGRAYNNLGGAQMQAGQVEEALKSFEKAIDLHKKVNNEPFTFAYIRKYD